MTMPFINNIIMGDVVIIHKDTEVIGDVLKASRNHAFGGSGHLEINIKSIKTLNGVEIPLNGYVKDKGNSDGGAVAVGVLVSVVGGLFMKGENIYFAPGQTFRVTVQKDTDLMATPETLKEVMKAQKTPQGMSLSVAVAK